MTPKEIGQQLFEEKLVNDQNSASLINRLTAALKSVKNKNNQLEKEYKNQSILIERLKLALKQQLSSDKTQDINSKIQKQQINQLVRDLNKTEVLIEEVKTKFVASVKRNKQKSLKNKIINLALASMFLGSLWPIYLYQQQTTKVSNFELQVKKLENELTHYQGIAASFENKAKKNTLSLNKEREELILELNKKIEEQEVKIKQLNQNQNAKILSFKEDIENIQREYIAKLKIIRNQSGNKISLLEMENSSLAETLKKEQSKPRELIIFKTEAESPIANNKAANLLDAISQNNQPESSEQADNHVVIPTMAEALLHYSDKGSIKSNLEADKNILEPNLTFEQKY